MGVKIFRAGTIVRVASTTLFQIHYGNVVFAEMLLSKFTTIV